MKAISLHQPWASLIACGAKRFETRRWAPPRHLIGQTIAIHAAKHINGATAEFATELMYGQHPTGGHELAFLLAATMDRAPDTVLRVFGQTVMPVGCVVAIVRLVAAIKLGPPAEGTAFPAATVDTFIAAPDWRPPSCFTVRYDDFGDYSPGRWAWLLRDAKPLNPPPAAHGRQGFFDLPQGWLVS